MDQPTVNEDEAGVLASPVKLQTNFTSFGMVACLFTYDPVADIVNLVSEDGEHHYFAVPLATLGKVKHTRNESRLVFTHEGHKYRLLFQSSGNAAASNLTRRVAGSKVAGKLVKNNGYDDWFALLRQRGQIT
ncbi:MAG: hypothetical protein ABW195_12475 [Ilumatobacteraceae bacterium]